MACVAAISLIVAEAAYAKAERETRRRSSVSRTTQRASKSARVTNAPAKKNAAAAKATVKTQVEKPGSTRRVRSATARATSNRRAPARRVVRGYHRPPSAAMQSVLRESSAYPPKDVLNLALRAYACGEAQGTFEQPYLTIIDYSLPSVARRLWVLDVRTRRVLFHELVAHGRNSGEIFAAAFSNAPGSYQSSIGLYRTEDVYTGQHGGSLRLVGLEPGYNDLAWDRAIVMHGARYVSANHVAQYGKLGRSLGCPALPLGVHQRIIERIQGGSAVFAYYPDRSWLRSSRYLHCDARLAQR